MSSDASITLHRSEPRMPCWVHAAQVADFQSSIHQIIGSSLDTGSRLNINPHWHWRHLHHRCISQPDTS